MTEYKTVIDDEVEKTPFVKKAQQSGFYEPGWELEDYIRNSIDSYG